MRNFSILAVAVTGLCATPLLLMRTARSEPLVVNRDKSTATKLNGLLVERRDTLKQVVKIVRERHRQGAGSADSVMHASLQLLQAELELARDRTARIALYKERVDLLRELEKIAQLRFKTGAGRPDDYLSAKAARLEAEIQLLRAQSAK